MDWTQLMYVHYSNIHLPVHTIESKTLAVFLVLTIDYILLMIARYLYKKIHFIIHNIFVPQKQIIIICYVSLSLSVPVGGTYWGEGGWFRLVRGVDNLGVESNCDWAVPAAIN